MYSFNYSKPSDVNAAVAKAGAGARPLAGGQTLLASMKLRLSQSDELVDLGGIASLSGIKREGNNIVIGAMTKHAAVAESAEVRGAIPALADLAGHIGDRAVRNMGTIGGSLANNDPSACYPSAVLALNATVHTNKRTIGADAFFTGMFATALDEGELITAVSFPIPQKAAYAKFVQPASRFALIGVFVAHTGSGARVAVTGGGNGVTRHSGLEAALTASFTSAAAKPVKVDASGLNADLHASAAYRANLISVQTQRAVDKANGIA
jgi:aerobic carbon-monoxide dehydrogenase medium subunit